MCADVDTVLSDKSIKYNQWRRYGGYIALFVKTEQIRMISVEDKVQRLTRSLHIVLNTYRKLVRGFS